MFQASLMFPVQTRTLSLFRMRTPYGFGFPGGKTFSFLNTDFASAMAALRLVDVVTERSKTRGIPLSDGLANHSQVNMAFSSTLSPKYSTGELHAEQNVNRIKFQKYPLPNALHKPLAHRSSATNK